MQLSKKDLHKMADRLDSVGQRLEELATIGGGEPSHDFAELIAGYVDMCRVTAPTAEDSGEGMVSTKAPLLASPKMVVRVCEAFRNLFGPTLDEPFHRAASQSLLGMRENPLDSMKEHGPEATWDEGEKGWSVRFTELPRIPKVIRPDFFDAATTAVQLYRHLENRGRG